MEEKRIKEIERKVNILLREKRLKPAVEQMGEEIDFLNSWELRTRYSEVMTAYNYMLEYMCKGMPDPNRALMHSELIGKAYLLNDEIAISRLAEHSLSVYCQMRRKYKGVAAISDYHNKLREHSMNRAMMQLMPGNNDKIKEIAKRHEQESGELFMQLWSEGSWSNKQRSDAQEMLDDIEVDMNGGNYEVRYKISNPKEDVMVVCEASETWVNIYNIDFEVVKFEVEANNGPKRECCVTMKYPYAEDRSFIIYQGGKTTEGFEFENITYSYDSLTLDIIPDNKEMPYIIRCYAPEEVYDYGLITGDDFYGYDIENIDMLQYVKYGNQCGVTFSNLVSRTPYTICCYYIDYETFRLLSDVDIFTITTDGPSLILVDFMAEYSFENANLSVDVMPVNYSGDYYFDIVNVTEIDGLMVRYPHFITNIEEAIEYWWAYKVCGYKLYMTIDEIIKHYSCNGVNDDGRPKSHREFDVEEHAEYYLVAYALDENALCRSFPVYVIIKNNGAQH
jgi:hypothetical protein